MALAASVCAAGRLVNSKKHRLEHNGGGFQRRLELKIGDLLSHPLSPATRPPCARPFMLTRPIRANTCMFKRAPVHACAPATRAHPLLLAICSHALSCVFQEPKTLPEYKHFELSDLLNPSPGKKHIFSFEALQSRSRPLPRFASMCNPTNRITAPFSPLDMHLHYIKTKSVS